MEFVSIPLLFFILGTTTAFLSIYIPIISAVIIFNLSALLFIKTIRCMGSGAIGGAIFTIIGILSGITLLLGGLFSILLSYLLSS